jgi:hypothetical protein
LNYNILLLLVEVTSPFSFWLFSPVFPFEASSTDLFLSAEEPAIWIPPA